MTCGQIAPDGQVIGTRFGSGSLFKEAVAVCALKNDGRVLLPIGTRLASASQYIVEGVILTRLSA